MIGMEWPAILVSPQERDVEVVTREVEVVGIAAEEGDGELGREDEADVLEAAVPVQIVAAAVIKRDDVAADLRVAAGAFLFDLRHRALLCLGELLARKTFGRGGDARRDV